MIGSLSTENEAVTLRALSLEDATAYYQAVDENRTHLSTFSSGVIKRYESIDSVLQSIIEPDPDGRQQLGIWDDETLVGSIGIKPQKSHLGTVAEIGYWLRADQLHKGYATVATRALSDYAHAKYKAVVAYADEGNLKSRAVLERSGFTFRDHVSAKEGKFDLFRYTDSPRE